MAEQLQSHIAELNRPSGQERPSNEAPTRSAPEQETHPMKHKGERENESDAKKSKPTDPSDAGLVLPVDCSEPSMPSTMMSDVNVSMVSDSNMEFEDMSVPPVIPRLLTDPSTAHNQRIYKDTENITATTQVTEIGVASSVNVTPSTQSHGTHNIPLSALTRGAAEATAGVKAMTLQESPLQRQNFKINSEYAHMCVLFILFQKIHASACPEKYINMKFY